MCCSTGRLIAFLLLTTFVSFFLWRGKLWWKAPLFLAAFFVLVYLWELLSLRRNEAAAATEVDSEPPVTPVSDAEFTLVSDPDDGGWYQKRIMLEGRAVRIRISDRRGVYEAALPYAEALVIDRDLLARRFREFKSAQAPRFPAYQQEVLGLEIESIEFVSRKEPAAAAVYFTEESLGDVFMCALENGEFCALWIES